MLLESKIIRGTREELHKAIEHFGGYVSHFARDTMYIHDDKIVFRYTLITTGLNKTSGKRYYRFNDTKTEVYKVRELHGRKFLYCYRISEGKVRDGFPPSVGHPAYAYVLRLCRSLIGPYPDYVSDAAKSITNKGAILKWYNKPLTYLQQEDFFVSQYKKLRGVSPRLSNPSDLTKALFPSMHRKDVIKAVAKSPDFYSLLHFSEFVDDIVEALGKDLVIEALTKHSGRSFDSVARVLRYLSELRAIPVAHRRKFVIEDNPSRSADTLIMVTHTPADVEVDFRGSVDSIHERLTRSRRIRRDAMYLEPFNYGKDILSLEDDGFELPRDADELSKWSQEFSNCSYSYASQIRAGRSYVVLYPEYEAMIEIRGNGQISQVLGKYNQTLSSEAFWVILDKLDDSKATGNSPYLPENIWGYVPQEELV